MTVSEILAAITIIGAIVGAVMFFRRPQEALDKRQAVSETEVQGTAKVLAQQVQWEKENTDKKFKEMGESITQAFKFAENHTHTVDVKVDKLIDTVNLMSNEITKLATIIEERVPRK